MCYHAHIVVNLFKGVNFFAKLTWQANWLASSPDHSQFPILQTRSYWPPSLVPRPHPWGGKRVWWLWAKSLVQLMTRGGICASQSDRSFSPVIWLASRRNVAGPLAAIQIWIAYTALTANQIRVLFKHTHVGACVQNRPNRENGPKSPDPFPSFEGGVWGRDYWPPISSISIENHSDTCVQSAYIFYREREVRGKW